MRPALLCSLLPLLAAAAPAAAQPADIAPAAGTKPPSQVLVEGGWCLPLGDLAGSFRGTERGFGAGPAFEAGFRWRLHLSRRFALAAAFHFVDFRDHVEPLPDQDEDFRVQTSSLRYTVEATWALRAPEHRVVPYVGVGGGLYHNRLQGYTKYFDNPLEEAVETFGAQFRAGVRLDDLELSVLYHLNRFSTWRFFRTGQDEDYSWDSVSVRLGWILPLRSSESSTYQR